MIIRTPMLISIPRARVGRTTHIPASLERSPLFIQSWRAPRSAHIIYATLFVRSSFFATASGTGHGGRGGGVLNKLWEDLVGYYLREVEPAAAAIDAWSGGYKGSDMCCSAPLAIEMLISAS